MMNNNVSPIGQYFEAQPNCKLYEPDHLAVDFPSNHSLNVIHLNIRSFNRNIDEFKLFLSRVNVNFSVIILTETWEPMIV